MLELSAPQTASLLALQPASPRVILQKVWHLLALLESPMQALRKLLLRARGAVIGQCRRNPRLLNYPHYWTPGPAMSFGDRVFIGRSCEFNIREKITVGNDCLIASGCVFVDSNHGTSAGTCINAHPLQTAAIVLERYVWLGAHCVVLKSVHIGVGVVIGTGSVVTKSVPAGKVWAGVPARRLSTAQEVRP